MIGEVKPIYSPDNVQYLRVGDLDNGQSIAKIPTFNNTEKYINLEEIAPPESSENQIESLNDGFKLETTQGLRKESKPTESAINRSPDFFESNGARRQTFHPSAHKNNLRNLGPIPS
jgi:hypothetical protein